MGKINQTGRNKNGHPFVMLPLWMLHSPAYRSLSATARALLVELMSMYNGSNNGELYLSQRDAAERLNIRSHGTVAKYFRELEAKGFIKARVRGSFDNKVALATVWILTMHGYRDALATKDFMRLIVLKPKFRVGKSDQTGLKSGPVGLKMLPEGYADGCETSPRPDEIGGAVGSDNCSTYNIPGIGAAAIAAAASPPSSPTLQ